jgi:phage N-6-adenine-methyltransferase
MPPLWASDGPDRAGSGVPRVRVSGGWTMTGRCVVCREKLPRRATGRPRSTCSDACRQRLYRQRQRATAPTRTDEWPTPQDFFAKLDAEFSFDLDPCATDENAKCARYFTLADDGLGQTWTGRVFMNPPYGRPLGAWMAKAWKSSQTTAEVVVCLVPARTDTRWWHELATRGEIRFRRGRLRFGDAQNSAPFPSAVIVFRNASGGPGRDETGGER